MKLNFNEYKDSVRACWIGKNIGGTMGAPYEAFREYLDIKGFATKPGEIIPNDDLDLQLIWLIAVERQGITAINSKLLGEYWMSFITPYWNEYGIGKCNMGSGIAAPLSGDVRNKWKHSNGAWIRTEIWASIFPGRPDLAARYSIEDAAVDHGTGEGTYAAAFVAAMQSSAFVVKNLRVCIDIALSKIPEDCRVAKSVRLILDCYDKKLPARQSRDLIQQSNADIGDGWFEAPSNVAYTVLGLLYGEGDFKKSMIAAINCGDDTDCTGATVGATFGILHGMKGVPEDWRAHIGDSIQTISLATGTVREYPKSCTELTDRVVEAAKMAAPLSFLYPELIYDWQTLEFVDGDSEITEKDVTKGDPINEASLIAHLKACPIARNWLANLRPNSFVTDFTIGHAVTSFPEGIEIAAGETIPVKVEFFNHIDYTGSIPYQLRLRWILPDGFTASAPKALVMLPHRNERYDASSSIEFTLTAGEVVDATNRAILEVLVDGRPSCAYIPVVLIGK